MTPYLKTYNKEVCCSCGMCEKVCPVNAIKMQEDEDGFWYPSFDDEECIRCGRCERTCQYDNKNVKSVNDIAEIECYACKSKNIKILQESSSGGVFYFLAKRMIELGGDVYGAMWTSDYRVVHGKIKEILNISKLQGSKYVFSEIGNTYIETKELLKAGKNILYSGTPCQINGLYAFLNQDYPNLLTCDLICHGVPSKKYLKMFVDELELEYKSKIKSIQFKNKEKGWRNPQFKAEFINGKIYKDNIWNTVYGKLYHQRITTMSCCNACVYATLPRKSDITIGDFWGYSEEKYHLGNDKGGISTVLLNTDKGKMYFNNIKDAFEIEKITLADSMQLHLQESAKPPEKSKKDRFEKLIKTNSLVETYKKLSLNHNSIFEKIKNKLFYNI